MKSEHIMRIFVSTRGFFAFVTGIAFSRTGSETGLSSDDGVRRHNAALSLRGGVKPTKQSHKLLY